MKTISRNEKRTKRHLSLRQFLKGSSSRPRLSVYRSNKYIYAQIIDDLSGKTLVSESDLKITGKTKLDKSFEIGKKIAEKALKSGITTVVFDRGGFLYHGRIAKLAEGAREGGLKF